MVSSARATFSGVSRFASGIFWIYGRIWRSWPYQQDKWRWKHHRGTLLPSTSSSFQKFQQYNHTHFVFESACCSSNGISLNDTLLVGPIIQEDMYSILLWLRTHQTALITDTAKMYCQVNINQGDGNLQQILWRRYTDDIWAGKQQWVVLHKHLI